MNTDLESDCEAVMSRSKYDKQQPRQNSATSTMNLSKTSTEKGGSSSTKTNNIQKKNDNGILSEINFFSISKNFPLNLGSALPKIQSLASTNLDGELKN